MWELCVSQLFQICLSILFFSYMPGVLIYSVAEQNQASSPCLWIEDASSLHNQLPQLDDLQEAVGFPLGSKRAKETTPQWKTTPMLKQRDHDGTSPSGIFISSSRDWMNFPKPSSFTLSFLMSSLSSRMYTLLLEIGAPYWRLSEVSIESHVTH